MLSQEQLDHATTVVYQHMAPTPCYQWPQLCAALGADAWVKHENHTPIGAFKVRSGLVYVEQLVTDGFQGDLVTATRGNHGQAIPYAARQYDLPVHVYVPVGNSQEKNAAMEGWGAILHEAGADYDAAKKAALAHVADRNGHFVPAYHPRIVAGVATYFAELYQQVADLEAVYVPIGMGSGAAAAVAVRDLMHLETEVIGVVAEGANAYAQSFNQGQVVITPAATTFADGLAVREPDAGALTYLCSGLSRIVEVSDEQIADAVRLLFKTTHNVAEGAGAAAFAALAKERDLNRHRRVAGILTGGNVDTRWFADILSGRTPQV